jgi:hypothetical protein
MFDPRIGRWLSQDPIGFQAGDTNLYRYVENDPTNATDPSGLHRFRRAALTRDPAEERRAWYAARSSGTMRRTYRRDGQQYQVELRYTNFSNEELETVWARVGDVRYALGRVLNDIRLGGRGENIDHSPMATTYFDRLSFPVRASLRRLFCRGMWEPITNLDLFCIRDIFERAAMAIDVGLRVLNDPVDDGNWAQWDYDNHVIRIKPAFYTQLSPRLQAGNIIHEVTHIFGTVDFGYVVRDSYSHGALRGIGPSYVRNGNPVTLTSLQLRNNADTYAWFLFDYYLTFLRE